MTAIELQSQDHRDLLDIVDKLRSLGVNRYIDLPQIVVCGDQSAGKSSVLEAISGLSFPTRDTLCTRFPTELVLRRDEDSSVSVSIIPGHNRTQQEKENLSKFGYELDAAKPDLEAVVDAAKQAMGISDTKTFSTDTLRVELTGPHQPHLTLVDLPGLFRSSNREQSSASAPIVLQMVRDYISKARSIILAVVSAQYDTSLQYITELSTKFDPPGDRTLGLITKPDVLPRGSESESSFIVLAQNKDIVFRLGWHVLQNRSFETRNASTEERDSLERKFFSNGLWAHLDPGTVGIESLRPRLSTVLRNQILQQLPTLLEEVLSGIVECRRVLEQLGKQRTSLADKRQYLRQISWSFSLLMKAAVNGHYSDVFFEQSSTVLGCQKRLRAVVQNELQDFADTMRQRGRAQVIIDDDLSDNDDDSIPRITRSSYPQHVKRVMRRSRGCELPGTFNPLIIGELFRDQSSPWQNIVSSATQTIVDAARKMARIALENVAVPEVVDTIFARVDSAIDILAEKVAHKIDELLRPYLVDHPITYDHYLTDTVQKVQQNRNKSMQVDMEAYASELATDYMQAYYKVAMKRLIDDVSTLAIEAQLMQKLSSILDLDSIDGLSDREVAVLAAESGRTIVERSRQQEKLTSLEMALQELRRLQKHRAFHQESQNVKEEQSSPTYPQSGTTPSRQSSLGPEPEPQLELESLQVRWQEVAVVPAIVANAEEPPEMDDRSDHTRSKRNKIKKKSSGLQHGWDLGT